MDDIEKLIVDNMGLVYKQLYKFNRVNDDDAYSRALEALASAAVSYDNSKGFAFSTYASACIYNAIAGYLRSLNKKRQLEVVSYETTVGDTEDIKILDMIKDNNTPETEYLRAELYKQLWIAFDKVYEELPTDFARRIVELWRDSEFTASQTEIAKEVGTSQANVSRTLSAFKHKLKKEMEEYLC